ncbi:MAG: hypothetical protein AAGH76_08925 [Pseudomonadota bacterium]
MRLPTISAAILSLGLVTVANSYDAEDVLATVQGTWGWAEGNFACEDGGSIIDVSSDRQRLTITFANPIEMYDGKSVTVTGYDILAVDDTGVNLKMDNETRAHEGVLLTWRIQLDGNDRYFWEALEAKAKDGVTGRDYWSWGPIERCQ